MRELLISLSCIVAACGSSNKAPTQQIIFGAAIDRTGSLATPSWGNALTLATTDVNAALAMSTNHKSLGFEFLNEDSTNTTSVATMQALSLYQMGAKAVVADSSQDDIATNKLNYDASGNPTHALDIPIVCIACTSPGIDNPMAASSDPQQQATLQNGLGWNFRTVMNASPQTVVLVSLFTANNGGDVNRDGTVKLDIYATNEPFGQGFSNAMKTTLLAANPNAVIMQLYDTQNGNPDVTTYNWAADMATMTSGTCPGGSTTCTETTGTGASTDTHPPDTIVEVLFPQYTAAIVKAYQQGGYTVRFLHTHTFRFNTVLLALGSSINGSEGTSHVLLDDPTSGATFSSEMMSTFGVPPAFWDSNAYDAGAIIMLASMIAAKGMPDPTKITGANVRDAIPMVSAMGGTTVHAGPAELAKAINLIDQGQPIDYVGASGPCQFTNGNVLDKVSHWMVSNGAFTDTTIYDCVSNPKTCPAL